MNKEQKLNIAIVILLMVLTFFITRSVYNKQPNVNNITKEYVITKGTHTIDSTNYYNQLNTYNNQLSDLINSNELLKKNYSNILKQIDNAPDSIKTVLYPIVINSCDSVVNKQDEVIELQQSIIKSDSIYIKSQENTITQLDKLYTDSKTLLDESNDNLLKTKKKLNRTRKIGITSTITSFFGGLFLGTQLK